MKIFLIEVIAIFILLSVSVYAVLLTDGNPDIWNYPLNSISDVKSLCMEKIAKSIRNNGFVSEEQIQECVNMVGQHLDDENRIKFYEPITDKVNLYLDLEPCIVFDEK